MTDTRPTVPPELAETIAAQLAALYGAETGMATWERLRERLLTFVNQHPPQPRNGPNRLADLSAADAMLITYGDQVQAPGEAPLATLGDWLRAHLGDTLTSVHLLPFYPYSSDDGFSVIDYTAVDPQLGAWDDVRQLSSDFRLMFDAVINHLSAHSAWFQGFLNGDPRYADWFIVLDEPVDVSMVTRPRTHPLLTTFQTATGPHNVWTTFSTDQIDLNFANPDVLLAIIDVLLLYVAQGASYLRLDAIGFLWKELGTTSIHLPQTHIAVQLIRSVMDVVAPRMILITETNVPHLENISYFGSGSNEAQLVYQFPLAPLMLHAMQTGNASYLQGWARTLELPSPDTAFFNFLASHDGIGVRPATGILDDNQIAGLVALTERHGGRVSYKTNSDGSQSPYELNITWFDAISDPHTTDEATAIARFVVTQAIMLALAGLPGIYIHSLVGSRNDHAGMARTGHNRTINRQKWQRAAIDAELADPTSRAARVLQRYRHLLQTRARSAALGPHGAQAVLASDPALFVLERTAPDGSERVVCIHNLTGEPQRWTPNWSDAANRGDAEDLFSGQRIVASADAAIDVAAYGVLWLRFAAN